MEHWEFLLQKDGDRSWLPLDSPDMEILEGRYRIVARSGWVNAPIEVRITHIATEETPPKRRIQKRVNRTNSDGLMVVIPFTRLQPGLWELQCASGDLMDDLIKGHSKYGLTLHVVPSEAEIDEFEPDWSPVIEESTPASSLLPEDASALPDRTSIPIEPALAVAETSETETPEAAAPDDRDASFQENVSPQIIAASWLEAAASPPAPTSAAPSVDRSTLSSSDIAQLFDAPIEQWRDLTEQLSDRLVDELWQDFELELSDAPSQLQTEQPPSPIAPAAAASTGDNLASLASDFDSAPEPSNHAPLPLFPDRTIATDYSVQLDGDVLIASRGEALRLTGRVNIGSAEDLNDLENAAIAQELQLCLRDPQSQQILVCDRQSLSQSTVPAPFEFTIVLPEGAATRLVLGEVLLCGVLPDPSGAAAVLANAGFTITVNPNELIEELTRLNALTEDLKQEQSESVSDLSAALTQEDAAPSLELSFLNLEPIEPNVSKPAGLSFLAGNPLPPQIHQPDPGLERRKALQLPSFGPLQSRSPEAVISSPAEPENEVNPPNEVDSPEEAESLLVEAEPAMEAVAVDAESAVPDSQTEEPDVSLEPEAILESEESEDLPEPVEMAIVGELEPPLEEEMIAPDAPKQLPPAPPMEFQSLKLQERFFNRLTAMATDAELSMLLKGESPQPAAPAPVLELAPATTGINPFGRAIGVTQDADWLAYEIVVDDEPAPVRKPPETPSLQVDVPVEPSTLVLPEDDPVPTPNLQVTAGELIAGQAVNVRVTLPNLLPRIYVKLWINDRQTRTLLEGPRWLVDFLPNSRDELEAVLQLSVPFGSLDIRFEAIAVEMATQRESHKVVVERSVVPPDLPALALNEFIA